LPVVRGGDKKQKLGGVVAPSLGAYFLRHRGVASGVFRLKKVTEKTNHLGHNGKTPSACHDSKSFLVAGIRKKD